MGYLQCVEKKYPQNDQFLSIIVIQPHGKMDFQNYKKIKKFKIKKWQFLMVF